MFEQSRLLILKAQANMKCKTNTLKHTTHLSTEPGGIVRFADETTVCGSVLNRGKGLGHRVEPCRHSRETNIKRQTDVDIHFQILPII